MKTRASIAWEAGKPLTIETIEVGAPRAGEVLVEIKATPELADLALVRMSRLSVLPVSAAHWKLLCRMGGCRRQAWAR